MTVAEGLNKGEIFLLGEKEMFSIGRKETCDIYFEDDQHISGSHANIYRIQQNWFI